MDLSKVFRLRSSEEKYLNCGILLLLFINISASFFYYIYELFLCQIWYYMYMYDVTVLSSSCPSWSQC